MGQVRIFRRSFLVFLLVLATGAGCSRKFFRERTDQDVCHLLAEKNQFEPWKIEQFHVYPDPQARFADPDNPDRPPMPPDDPAARAMAPNPQKPGKNGVSIFEGTGYLDLLAAWDSMNRQDPSVVIQPEQLPLESGGVQPTSDGPSPAERAFVLRLEQACELGLINSRDFQDQREALYISALPVSLQRFSFAAQFTSGGDVFRESTGSQTGLGRRERWRASVNDGATKLFPTGALLLFRFANQLSLEMLNGRPNTSVSAVTLELTQPLLQGGGLAVNLEPLTQAERNLVYSIRSYARFRKIFYVSLAAGSSAATDSSADVAAGLGLAPGAFTPAAGYLPAVLRYGQLEIDQRNYIALRDLVRRFEAFAEGGEVSQLQVDNVKQDMLSARSSVLQDEFQLRNSLDNFKRQLGMSPSVRLDLDLSPLGPMTKQIDRYQQILREFEEVQVGINKDPGPGPEGAAQLRERFKTVLRETALLKGTAFRERIIERWGLWEKRPDEQVRQSLAAIRGERRQLFDQKTKLEAEQKPVPEEMRRRIADLENEQNIGEFEEVLRQYEKQPWLQLGAELRETRRKSMFRFVAGSFTLVLVEPRNQRFAQVRELWPSLPPVILEGMDLIEVPLDAAYTRAAQTALANRLDLMNARGQLVDSWRQIAIRANGLMGVLDVNYHVDSATPGTLAQPFGFSGTRTTHRLGLNWELPLVRRLERNNYRVALINYQRQRRSLQATEDNILNTLRSEIRQLRVFAENYRIQQDQIALAYAQVENALDTFGQPQLPGAVSNAGNAAALTQQVLNAQRSLNNAQRSIYNIWINYLTFRMQLYRDLELLPLDARGVWIDEYLSLDRPTAPQPSNGERLPQPKPVVPAFVPPNRSQPERLLDEVQWRARPIEKKAL